LKLEEHRRDQKVKAVVALIVTSDSRTMESDETGKNAVHLLEEAGHRVSSHVIVPNDTSKIHEMYTRFLIDPEVQVIITSGGTGISSKDKTVATVSSTLEKLIPGFGELFRRLSFEEIGHAAMSSRATAGTIHGKLIFCLPGSKGAMETALREIILPSLGHMLWELNR
jgi:molybdenum cofactor biosynthesis protein B|tara:strand:+ start:6484 stop:6987 length:504 start_codon:yes stop_codon:yes gene_type:complete